MASERLRPIWKGEKYTGLPIAVDRAFTAYAPRLELRVLVPARFHMGNPYTETSQHMRNMPRIDDLCHKSLAFVGIDADNQCRICCAPLRPRFPTSR